MCPSFTLNRTSVRSTTAPRASTGADMTLNPGVNTTAATAMVVAATAKRMVNAILCAAKCCFMFFSFYLDDHSERAIFRGIATQHKIVAGTLGRALARTLHRFDLHVDFEFLVSRCFRHNSALTRQMCCIEYAPALHSLPES